MDGIVNVLFPIFQCLLEIIHSASLFSLHLTQLKIIVLTNLLGFQDALVTRLFKSVELDIHFTYFFKGIFELCELFPQLHIDRLGVSDNFNLSNCHHVEIFQNFLFFHRTLYLLRGKQ